MESLILGWFMLVETGSVMLLSLYGSLLLVGTLISPLLGMLGDRFGLRKVLATMRSCYALFAALILLLALTKSLSPTLVLVIAALAGLIRPTDIGMRSALVGATVPPSHLTAAMGISRTTQDSARIGGALLGTGFMAVFGMVPAYLVICGFYLAGVWLTLQVRAPAAMTSPESIPSPATAVTTKHAGVSPWRELKDGLAYVWQNPRLRAGMCLAALVNLTAFPFTGALMPYIARNVLQLDQQGLGWLVAAFGTGALIGSVGLSAFGSQIQPARTMLIACLVWHLCLFGFVLSSNLIVAIVLLAGAGFMQSLSMISLSILLLRTSHAQYRGRVMGVRMLAIYTLPLGLLAAGATIPKVGFQSTAIAMLTLGVLLAIGIAYVWRQDLLRSSAAGDAL